MHASTLGRRARHSRKSALVAALQAESETLQNITDYFVPLMRVSQTTPCYHFFFFLAVLLLTPNLSLLTA